MSIHYNSDKFLSVHCGKPFEACDDNGRKTLSEYISRAPFSLERMSFNENSKIVVYKGEHFHPTLARNFDVSDPLEWIAQITSHIPKKGAKQVIYYGSYTRIYCWYSLRSVEDGCGYETCERRLRRRT
jgi:hypothetical protein